MPAGETRLAFPFSKNRAQKLLHCIHPLSPLLFYFLGFLGFWPPHLFIPVSPPSVRTMPDNQQNKKRVAGQTTFGDDMKYEDPKMEEYWNTLPDGIQSLINESGIDICSLGMLMKLGDYYKNDPTRMESE